MSSDTALQSEGQQQPNSAGAVVASATVIASEVLADFLDSLVEPPMPTRLKESALRAASRADTDALLALPLQLDQTVSHVARLPLRSIYTAYGGMESS